jgi:crotonobetainyl-CoA:carnitine CoA-transferase CaiB-like acyl-CoA transferase
MTGASSLPLSRFAVVDLTRARAGPTAVRQLADWGAKVIKVEARDGDGVGNDRHDSDFQNLHRNKRSMTLDLKASDGLEVFRRLVARSDIVVENYRPDVKHRLGIDYESMKRVNPRLIYASISGFGQDGPYRMRPGFDQIAQGMSGLMSVTGLPGQGPVRTGVAISDVSAGIMAAMGILLALIEREASGEGQWVQTSLLESAIAMLDFQATRWLVDRQVPEQAGNNHPTGTPYGVFCTADGHINIAAWGDTMFTRLCRALKAEHLAADPAFATVSSRHHHRDRLNAAIEAVTVTRPAVEWIDKLNAADVPCGPIYRIDQTFADPQVRHLGIAQPVEHPVLGRLELVGQAVHLSRTPAQLRCATPELGADTDAILSEIGYDSAAIADLRKRSVI